ncbi:MAG TPA: septal ring lytic transglycosylase RlpA family protein [Terracidiphilus sp.]|nr:septal ring lytic transglycosylase RlpA family protein [Terracidiphilus sp.]
MRRLTSPSTLRIEWMVVVLMAAMIAAGCGHKKTRVSPTATAPPVYTPPRSTNPSRTPGEPPAATGRIPVTPLPEGGISAEDKEFILSHRPIFSEEGQATWYTAPYKGRKAANGQVFRDEALTAAHRTLPMGSLIVVTNLKTRQASAMRISDRGPFVPTAILDLTKASARSIGIWPGSGRVRVDVYETPKPMDVGGRWCVQIGPFTSERKAIRFKQKLIDEYGGSRVIEFPGERSYWVRIRPAGDDREQAEGIARHLRPDEGVAYLTRLD